MTSSHKLTDFLLENDFIELAAKEQEERRKKIEVEKQAQRESELASRITQANIDQAKKEGYEEGVQAGKNQALLEFNSELSKHLDQLNARFEKLTPERQHMSAVITEKAVHTLDSILKHTLNHVAENYSEEMFKNIISTAITSVENDFELRIHLHPSSVGFIEQHAPAKLKDYKFKVIPDNNITQGDVLIEWDTGGIDARVSTVASQVEDILSGAISTLRHTENTIELHETDEVAPLDKDLQDTQEITHDNDVLSAEDEKDTNSIEENESEEVPESPHKE